MLVSLLLLSQGWSTTSIKLAAFHGTNFSCTADNRVCHVSVGYKVEGGPRLLVWAKHSKPLYFGAWIME